MRKACLPRLRKRQAWGGMNACRNADRSELLELLRHAEMLPEMRQRPERPAFQFGIVAVFGIGIEQRDRVLVRLDLGLVVTCVEVLAVLGLQLIQHLLVLAVERRGQRRLDLAAVDQGFQFA
jgi:hypothetical protein